MNDGVCDLIRRGGPLSELLHAINHTCKARFPLIGGRVEKFVLNQVIEGCDDELEYLAEAL